MTDAARANMLAAIQARGQKPPVAASATCPTVADAPVLATGPTPAGGQAERPRCPAPSAIALMAALAGGELKSTLRKREAPVAEAPSSSPDPAPRAGVAAPKKTTGAALGTAGPPRPALAFSPADLLAARKKIEAGSSTRGVKKTPDARKAAAPPAGGIAAAAAAAVAARRQRAEAAAAKASAADSAGAPAPTAAAVGAKVPPLSRLPAGAEEQRRPALYQKSVNSSSRQTSGAVSVKREILKSGAAGTAEVASTRDKDVNVKREAMTSAAASAGAATPRATAPPPSPRGGFSHRGSVLSFRPGVPTIVDPPAKPKRAAESASEGTTPRETPAAAPIAAAAVSAASVASENRSNSRLRRRAADVSTASGDRNPGLATALSSPLKDALPSGGRSASRQHRRRYSGQNRVALGTVDVKAAVPTQHAASARSPNSMRRTESTGTDDSLLKHLSPQDCEYDPSGAYRLLTDPADIQRAWRRLNCRVLPPEA